MVITTPIICYAKLLCYCQLIFWQLAKKLSRITTPLKVLSLYHILKEYFNIVKSLCAVKPQLHIHFGKAEWEILSVLFFGLSEITRLRLACDILFIQFICNKYFVLSKECRFHTSTSHAFSFKGKAQIPSEKASGRNCSSAGQIVAWKYEGVPEVVQW